MYPKFDFKTKVFTSSLFISIYMWYVQFKLQKY